MIIKKDCKFYYGSKPCKFHKADKRECGDCADYQPIKERILIIKLDALGDVLRTTSILPALKEKYPGSHITWITRTDAADLLNGNVFIDRILSYENNYLGYILNEEFDTGICLDAESSGATILSLADCREKKGFIVNKKGQLTNANTEAEKWLLMGVNDNLKSANRETYQSLIYDICGLKGEIRKPQIKLNEAAVSYSEYFKKKYGIKDDEIIIGLNTGGGSRWECKKWVKEYYVELIRMLGTGSRKLRIILAGGEKERELIKYIKDNSGGIVLDAESYDSLDKFAGIINLTDIFLTPDSLGFHISTALNKYTIVLVGPTSPWELDVYGNGEIMFDETLDCIACYDSVCKRNKECMKALTPALIYEKINKQIEKISNS